MPDGVCNPVRNVKSCVLELTSTLRTGISTWGENFPVRHSFFLS
jgi:hypothetical protein